MKLEKAIEIIETYMKGFEEGEPVDFDDALKLGKEALKFRQRWEEQEGEDDFPLLPGETEE